jgi:undecaprenyl-diphosphatase
MTLIQALFLAILQGVTELFPVSSLGHAVVIPSLLHMNIDQKGATFLPFLTFLHFGTAAALLLFFWQDWLALLSGLLGFGPAQRVRESRYIIMLIIIATVPAVVLGYAAEHVLRSLFGTPSVASVFLIVNGFILLLGEKLKSRVPEAANRPIAQLTPIDAFIIGCWQCLAFLPGISRSGATMVGSLLRNIDHQGAARFSFLIALPIIIAATASQLMALRHQNVESSTLVTAVAGACAAFLSALVSLAFLMRYFRNHEAWALTPFALYCLVFGGAGFILTTIV